MLNKLIEKLDLTFSKYIRLKYADHRGMVRCVTCGAMVPWQEIQNGHFVSRKNLATRWDEENCHPQCHTCNVTKVGNLEAYRTFLTRKFGPDKPLELTRRGRSTYKPMSFEIKEKIELFQMRIKRLEQKISEPVG